MGALGQTIPKPLVPVGGEPFLNHLLRAAVRQGFEHIVLLAGHLGAQVQHLYDHASFGRARLNVIVEEQPLGTGGALRQVRDHLAESFVAVNGDTYFDTNLRALDHGLQSAPDLSANIIVRGVDDLGRFGSVEVRDGRVIAFREKDPASTGLAGLINGGAYALRRDALERLPAGPSSIEHDLFPGLANAGRLGALIGEGDFIDIGLPDTYEQACQTLPQRLRPALFLDRDGVINHDDGYVHKFSELRWVEGVKTVIQNANNLGMAVIVVTNQAGIGRGFYTEGDVLKLHYEIKSHMLEQGVFIDDFYFSPFHPEAGIGRYNIPKPLDRKPASAMILRAARDHGLDLSRSTLIGDQASDIAAGQTLGIRALKFRGDDLSTFVESKGGLRVGAHKDEYGVSNL